jgi:hypothetical protein
MLVGWSDPLTGLTSFLLFQQMEQGTWLGTEHPMFNRFTAAATHYMRINRIPSFQAIATPSAVVHAKVGNTIGDLAPYDAQPLGGPFTVRSFDVGDIGTARRFLEVRRSALGNDWKGQAHLRSFTSSIRKSTSLGRSKRYWALGKRLRKHPRRRERRESIVPPLAGTHLLLVRHLYFVV